MKVWGQAAVCIAVALVSAPASAESHALKWSGVVQTVEGSGSGFDIRTGDAISAAFSFDSSKASALSQLPIGGGNYSIYDAPLTSVSLSIGAYSVSYPIYGGTLTYMNDSFGADGIVFTLDSLPGGPFQSTFANVQFQARGPVTAIDGSGLDNGLPYARLTPSFFATFDNGTTMQRVFGSLSVSAASAVPEPKSWTLMLAGFGLVGGALRQRRRSVTFRTEASW